MTKLLKIGVSLLVGSVMLAGCGGGGGSTAPPATTRSVASGYVYSKDGGRAAAPVNATRRLVVVRKRMQQAGYQPVANATVSLGGRPAVHTNAQGYFEIAGAPEGQSNVTIVPPPDLNCAPGSFGIIARPTGPTGPMPPPPIRPSDELYVLPPYAAVEEGDVVQFYAMAIGTDGPADITDQVTWKLRADGADSAIGTLSAGGLFTASRPGSAMVVAVLPGSAATESRQMETLPAVAEMGAMAPGDMPVRGFAFVDVLPKMTAIQGRVMGSNDLPLIGAFVFASGLPDFSVTDYNGGFFMPLVPPAKQLDLTVIYQGQVVGNAQATVAAGETKEVTIPANVPGEPQPVFAAGLLEKRDGTTWQYGTHVLSVDYPPPMPMLEGRAGSGGSGVAGGGTVVGGGGFAPVPMPGPGPDGRPTGILFALQSDTVKLNDYVGQFVQVSGTRVPGYPLNDGEPPLLNVKEVYPLAIMAADAAGVANAGRPQTGPAGPNRPASGNANN
ncbi:MAG: hypothetical protein COZ06_12620 [Armatimonadetes bacterium CG_4_10_14_3_um_filter_66_18]|nr:carboxypeptidase-like regulatory domain-containing protein [Armatimonadota bacterium]OIP04720.1 MAG: hypothetical protein AUJ96_12195 [Armatimonadetes bacterium CG2_30_66_41]PIX48614.1 MAG: hypothetical protein COZ57_05015 [Armatimonadetes bacterium CG_4_8_14_3_um_filter_66_20]PIY49811.1 MAG: hypothetical protein COZ06_12620 [Armatimonadetes bacterium CG_4_10_14_3_um_filter_66_18]NCO94818.1 carboxypeptidase-like regulatory domain-containing protein [Armatimonadota bacterium]